MKRLRVYADTSVFGGCFDEEFTKESKLFFADVKAGKFILVVSETIFGELEKAPDNIQKVLTQLPPEAMKVIEFSDEIAYLRDAYLKQGYLNQRVELMQNILPVPP